MNDFAFRRQPEHSSTDKYHFFASKQSIDRVDIERCENCVEVDLQIVITEH